METIAHFRLLLAVAALATVAAAPLPHLVVVIIDDWGWNDVGWHSRNASNAGEIITPNIDDLAARGVVLERFYVHQFW